MDNLNRNAQMLLRIIQAGKLSQSVMVDNVNKYYENELISKDEQEYLLSELNK